VAISTKYPFKIIKPPSSWPKSEQEMTVFVENNRYNIEILPELESYVAYQIEYQSYHLEANMTVLKLYQFFPDKLNFDILTKILIKALMSFPSNNFLLSLYLVPPHLVREEAICTLVELAQLLEVCQFNKFWSRYQACHFLHSIPGFQNAICSFISKILEMTYQSVDKEFLESVFDFHGEQIEAQIVAHNWKLQNGIVRFPLTDENQAKPKKNSDNLAFDQLGKILSSLN